MSGTGREIPTGLNEFQVVHLFKCAVKDDDTLVDAIVEKLYGTMKDFDAGRTKQTIELIVDRDTTAASRLRAGARTWSNTSAILIGFQRLLGLRLTVSEERPLIARCYSGACCGLPMLARVSS